MNEYERRLHARSSLGLARSRSLRWNARAAIRRGPLSALAVLSAVLVLACGRSPASGFEATNGEVAVLDAGDPFVDSVVAFTPGIGAGFGQGAFPGIVFGPPHGTGDGMGSLDVLSLGRGGSITLEFTDFEVVDGAGVDFIVFENGFVGFLELAFVEVSADGTTWNTFPCAATSDGGTEGCAGAHFVHSNPENGIPPTSPDAGGDGFDLAQLGVASARFVRITDTGTNRFYAPPGGGFDLDAIAIVNARAVTDAGP